MPAEGWSGERETAPAPRSGGTAKETAGRGEREKGRGDERYRLKTVKSGSTVSPVHPVKRLPPPRPPSPADAQSDKRRMLAREKREEKPRGESGRRFVRLAGSLTVQSR